jgi:hypothetical protein
MWTHDVGTGDVAVVVVEAICMHVCTVTGMDGWMDVYLFAEGDWSLFIIICNNYTT